MAGGEDECLPGWEIYPKGIYDFGMKMKEEYPQLKFFISENGMGVEHEDRFRDASGVIQDDYRIEFVKEHLEWIQKAVRDGAQCMGYHYWGSLTTGPGIMLIKTAMGWWKWI